MIYRSDQRAPDQMRPVNLVPEFISTAEGSVLIEVGNTRVICTATVEETVPTFLRNTGKGWVTAEYGMLPRSTLTRTPREAARGRASGRTLEIQRLIGRSLRAVVDLTRLGERTLCVDCDVIQADGGTRTAAITGAFVALGLALEQTASRRGTLQCRCPSATSWPPPAWASWTARSCSTSPTRRIRAPTVDMNIVATGERQLVEVQGTAELHPFDDEQLRRMLDLARAGIDALIARQKAVLTGLLLRQ